MAAARLLRTTSTQFKRLALIEPRLLLALAAVAGGIWLFAAIADEVAEGETHRVDRAVLLAMRNPGNVEQPIGPPYVQMSARDITALGGVVFLGFLTLVVGVFLMLSSRTRMALFVWAAVASGAALSTALKALFDRPRPELVPHGTIAYHASFPSGHAMLAAVTYLTLGALLAKSQQRRRIKIFVLAVAIFVTVAVGLTRIYLGVHWPTDVLAGWTAGAVWALVCWEVADWLERRRALPENEGGPQLES